MRGEDKWDESPIPLSDSIHSENLTSFPLCIISTMLVYEPGSRSFWDFFPSFFPTKVGGKFYYGT